MAGIPLNSAVLFPCNPAYVAQWILLRNSAKDLRKDRIPVPEHGHVGPTVVEEFFRHHPESRTAQYNGGVTTRSNYADRLPNLPVERERVPQIIIVNIADGKSYQLRTVGPNGRGDLPKRVTREHQVQEGNTMARPSG
jgi:hypothetical protein